MEALRQQYESLAYVPTIHPNTSPDWLSVIGRLLGLPAAAPTACRVLDLGCGQGTDLIVKAAKFPNSHFTGVDFSSPDIDTARRLAAEAGVKNVEFHQADLLEWELDGPPFDYIIAYGLFSWVPDEVKERLLKITARCLAPDGIACISYLTYPGCKQAEALRDLMELRAGMATGLEKARIAREVLGLLDRAYTALPKKAYSASMLEQVRRISTKEDNFLLHDDLGLVRDPVYFLQFVNMAADHGLHYLGDTEFQSLLVDNLPPETTRDFSNLGLDRLESQQFTDFVLDRSFRCTLLTHPQPDPIGQLHPAVMRELCFASELQPKDPSVQPGAKEAEFITLDQSGTTLCGELLVAFITVLARTPHAFLPYGEILAAAQTQAGRETQPFTPQEEDSLCRALVSLYGHLQIRLSCQPSVIPSRPADRPCLTLLNRALLRVHGMLATADDRILTFDEASLAFSRLLDGTRSIPELAKTPEARSIRDGGRQLLTRLQEFGCLQS
jgi:SAM-dependent methyltransferase